MSNEAQSRINQIQIDDDSPEKMSAGEKLRASLYFKDFVQELLDHGRLSGHTKIEKERIGSVDGRSEFSNSISLTMEQAMSDGSSMLVGIDATNGDYGDDRRIQVQELDTAGCSRRVSLYYLEGEEVRRYDVDDAYELALTNPVLIEGIKIVPNDRYDEMLATPQELPIDAEEVYFEDILAIYSEPVGFAEIQKLQLLIDDFS